MTLTKQPIVTDQQLIANARKPVTVSNLGVRIGEDEFPYPIIEGSIHVEQHGTYNALTLTMLVGEVTMKPGRRVEGTSQ